MSPNAPSAGLPGPAVFPPITFRPGVRARDRGRVRAISLSAGELQERSDDDQAPPSSVFRV